MKWKSKAVKAITVITTAAIMALYSPSAKAEEWEGSKFGTKTSIQYTLENELEISGNSLQDRGGNFTWGFGDDDFYYHDYPVIGWFERLGDRNAITIDGFDPEEFIKEIQPYFEDMITNSEKLADTLIDISSDQIIDAEEREYLTDLVNELYGEYTQDIEDLSSTLGKYEDIPDDILEKINIYDMPLMEVIGMFTEFEKLLHYEIEDGRIWAGRKLEGSAKLKNDLFTSYEKGNTSFEHGSTSKAQLDSYAYLEAELNWWPISLEFLENYGVPEEYLKYLEDYYIYEGNASLKAGTFLGYEYSMGDTYQFSNHNKDGKIGFGISREHFVSSTKENKNVAFEIDLNLEEGYASYTNEMESFDEEIKGQRLNLYTFMQKDKGKLWYNFTGGLMNEDMNIKSKYHKKTFTQIIDKDGNFSEIENEITEDKNWHENLWKANGEFLLGYQFGALSPYITSSDDDQIGMLINNWLLNGKIASSDGEISGSGCLRLFGKGDFSNYLRNKEFLELSPMLGKDAQADIMKKEHYSKINGLYLIGETNPDDYSYGGLLCFNNSLFIEGKTIGIKNHPGQGYALNIGWDKFMLSGKYIDSQNIEDETYTKEYGLSASGKFDNLYLDFRISNTTNSDAESLDDLKGEVVFGYDF